MSISAKLDEAITTDTLRAIGEATVKAFGDAKELAGAGVEATVSYVYWDAAIGIIVAGLWMAILIIAYIVAALMARGQRDVQGPVFWARPIRRHGPWGFPLLHDRVPLGAGRRQPARLHHLFGH